MTSLLLVCPGLSAPTYDGGMSCLEQLDYLSLTLARLLSTALMSDLVVHIIVTWHNIVTVQFPNLVMSTMSSLMQMFPLFIKMVPSLKSFISFVTCHSMMS